MFVPFFGWGLASLNPISINRNDGAKALKIILREAKIPICKEIANRLTSLFKYNISVAHKKINNIINIKVLITFKKKLKYLIVKTI